MALTKPQGDMMMKLGTEASASGTAVDFTGIPAGTTKIVISLVGVSTNGTSILQVQLGDAGGVETTGYTQRAEYVVGGASAGTAGFELAGSNAAANVWHGAITLVLEDSAQFTWVSTSLVMENVSLGVAAGAGSKSLSALLDRVRITTVNGTDTFDAGSINIAFL